MRKRRKARRQKAKRPLHVLRGFLGSWKDRLSKTPGAFSARSEQIAPTPVPHRTRGAVIPSNLHDKWKELKTEKEINAQSATEPPRSPSFYRKHRRVFQWSIIGLISFLAFVGTTQYLRLISKQKEADLIAAVKCADWKDVHQKLALSNVSVYHFFNPHLSYSISQAESWIQRQKDVHAQLSKKLTDIESGKIPLDSLSIHAVADLERTLRSLPEAINDLSSRWSMLHAQNREMFSKNRNYVMEQLLTQQEIDTFLTLNEVEDIAILRTKMDEWDDFLETCRAYDIPPHLKARGEKYLEDLRHYHEEAQALKDFRENLKEVVTYNELITQAQKKKATKYGPACNLFGFFHTLPTLEQWRKKMLPINKLISEGKVESAKAMLLRGGATYSTAFPVSQELYAQANELFAAPSLHQRFYQVFHDDGRVHISEEFPQRSTANQGDVVFTLSAMDSAYSTTAAKTISWESSYVKVRSICSAQLLQTCKINREELFLQANFPRLLEQIITVKAADCPTLAKAFVFHRVLQLMHGHPFFSLHLPQFAPTLTADAASFAKLHKKHESVMHCGAWLQIGSQIEAAERDFAHWFKTHQNRDYYVEIATTAAPLFSATPRYVGLADETGKPTLRIPLKASTVIWYMGHNGIQAAAPGKLPEEARPYSPLFINSNIH